MISSSFAYLMQEHFSISSLFLRDYFPCSTDVLAKKSLTLSLDFFFQMQRRFLLEGDFSKRLLPTKTYMLNP